MPFIEDNRMVDCSILVTRKRTVRSSAPLRKWLWVALITLARRLQFGCLYGRWCSQCKLSWHTTGRNVWDLRSVNRCPKFGCVRSLVRAPIYLILRVSWFCVFVELLSDSEVFRSMVWNSSTILVWRSDSLILRLELAHLTYRHLTASCKQL